MRRLCDELGLFPNFRSFSNALKTPIRNAQSDFLQKSEKSFWKWLDF